MSILESIKKKYAEEKAYNKILSEKRKIAYRQAYASESIKVSGENARKAARQPSQSRVTFFGGVNQMMASARQPMARPSVVAKARYKTVYKKKGKHYVKSRRMIGKPKIAGIAIQPRQERAVNMYNPGERIF